MTPFRQDFDVFRIQFEAEIERALPPSLEPEARVIEAARYSLLAGGKRLRPVLMLATSDMLGLPMDETLPFACSMEMIHTYSLIHDDLPCMDNDDLRRGRPTCHRQYDEATAVLAGDLLLNTAFEFLLAACVSRSSSIPMESRLQASSWIAQASGAHGMIGGQAMDMRYESETADDLTLERLHRMKTGALIEASILVPAILAGSGDLRKDSLHRYASSLGLAFQIGDDLLDATATAEKLGKTPGKDAQAGKTTYVTRFGLDNSRELLHSTITEAGHALADPSMTGLDTSFLQQMATYFLERES